MDCQLDAIPRFENEDLTDGHVHLIRNKPYALAFDLVWNRTTNTSNTYLLSRWRKEMPDVKIKRTSENQFVLISREIDSDQKKDCLGILFNISKCAFDYFLL